MAKHGAHRARPPKVRMTPARKSKMHRTMSEFSRGTLHSGSSKGPIVAKRSQAQAIGLSQARKIRATRSKRGRS